MLQTKNVLLGIILSCQSKFSKIWKHLLQWLFEIPLLKKLQTNDKAGYLPQKPITLSYDFIIHIKEKIITWIKSTRKFNQQKRFSTHLTTTIIILVTGSIILISGMLYISFQQRLKSEFNNKLLAQKGQIEIILDKRIAEVKGLLQSLSSDNTIRFAAEMGNISQLEERLKHFNSSPEPIYFYVTKQNEQAIYPKDRLNLFVGIEEILFDQSFDEEIIESENKTRLIWRFDAPIKDHNRPMGIAYALYDMAHDQKLIETLYRTVDGDISMAKANCLISLIDGKSVSVDEGVLKNNSGEPEYLHLGRDLFLTPLSGYKHLYFLSSGESLFREKKQIFLLLGLSSILVLAFSATLSVLLGKQMSRPLDETAAKAIQISEGKKTFSFDIKNGGYLEFNQLSQAFNYMMANLKEAEEKSRFTELLENVDDAVYLIDWKGKILNANEATYLNLGYAPEAFFLLDLCNILPEEDAIMVLDQLISKTKKNNPVKITFETYHIKHDGDFIPVEIKSRAITYRGAKVILNVARDVSERKETERTLRESEERYRSVVETSHDGILILDEQLKISYANNKLCQILGYSRKEIDGTDFNRFLVDKRDQLMIERYLHTPESMQIKQPCELNIVRKDEKERHCMISAAIIRNSAGEANTVVQLLDITDQFRAEQEKMQLEAQLRHSQKMEAVGTLAGGIAHDFNNLLHVIDGYTELLLLTKDKNETEFEKLCQIKDAAQRATELTKRLLTFSRKVESIMRPIDLNSEVIQIHKLLSRTIPQMIERELHLVENLATVNADTAQLGQMIMNLGVNARDAMPDGGKLIIKTKNVTLDKNFCDTHLGSKSGDYILLSISDTGEGIDEQSLEHIFEPFYTTKEVGKGTGLGLAIVYGIVKTHGGYIICESDIGKGTTFEIYLPVIDQKVSSEALEEVKDEKPQVGGDEAILLVDDNEIIRNLGHEILSKVGYTILTARDGETALELYHQKKNEIDLIILDLMMPGMGGQKCLEKLLQVNPKVKVLIASGQADNNSIKTEMGTVTKDFIAKPYKLQEILTLVREILDRN
ncbi:MAG: PAS domain S-box protein [Deltaproteobacteria bacterium]|nr:PAS domain S-box protein [Deltaproteobacteria bacterium]